MDNTILIKDIFLKSYLELPWEDLNKWMGFYYSIIIFYRIVTTFSRLFSYDVCTAILLTFTKIIVFFCSRNYRSFLFERKMWYENHLLFGFWCQFILVSQLLEFKIFDETFDGWFFYLLDQSYWLQNLDLIRYKSSFSRIVWRY